MRAPQKNKWEPLKSNTWGVQSSKNKNKYINILKNKKYKDFGLKGVPPAAKNHDFSDFGLKGVPPAAKKYDFSDLA